MSKSIGTIAKIALPIAAGFVLGPAGFGLTSAAVGSAIGGAAAGALGGGGIKGALIGGATGYLGAGALSSAIGSPASIITDPNIAGPSTFGSGLEGLATGGGAKALTGGVTSALASTGGSGIGSASSGTDLTKLLLGLGNQSVADTGAQTAKDTAKTQSASIDKAIQATQTANAPYTQLGADAANQIESIQADPAGYIKNNPLYGSLADDAQRRLLANQAAKGKVGSGGTAAALQEQLLNLGNGLVNQQIGTLQQQVGTGATAAGNVGSQTANLTTDKGSVNAAGQIGANNAYTTGYQNQINTLLALQGLNKTPIANTGPLNL